MSSPDIKTQDFKNDSLLISRQAYEKIWLKLALPGYPNHLTKLGMATWIIHAMEKKGDLPILDIEAFTDEGLEASKSLTFSLLKHINFEPKKVVGAELLKRHELAKKMSAEAIQANTSSHTTAESMLPNYEALYNRPTSPFSQNHPALAAHHFYKEQSAQRRIRFGHPDESHSSIVSQFLNN